jgi:hypothetical protein
MTDQRIYVWIEDDEITTGTLERYVSALYQQDTHGVVTVGDTLHTVGRNGELVQADVKTWQGPWSAFRYAARFVAVLPNERDGIAEQVASWMD